MKNESPVEFYQSIDLIEKCTQELAQILDRLTIGFFRRPIVIKIYRGLWTFIFSLFIIFPLVGVFEADAKPQRWLYIYFTIVSMLLGSFAMLMTIRPIDLDIFNSIITINGKMAYTISESGLKSQHNGIISIVPWRLISKCTLSKNFLIFEHYDRQFNYIPLTAFSSIEAIDSFAIAANQKITANATIHS